MIAALFVERGGCYWNLPGVDAWDKERDARLYAGPHPVVAHPPCERWGRYWHGSPRKPHQYKLGDDSGCFAAALAAVRRWGGVLEHPAYSAAWKHFRLVWPPNTGRWVAADFEGGWTCQVEQAHYGHMARKATWLYAHGVDLPSLIWGPAPQRLSQVALERHGYEKARRTGVMAYIGGKDKSKIRAATPPAFRDVLAVDRQKRERSRYQQERSMTSHSGSPQSDHRSALRLGGLKAWGCPKPSTSSSAFRLVLSVPVAAGSGVGNRSQITVPLACQRREDICQLLKSAAPFVAARHAQTVAWESGTCRHNRIASRK